ncbi:hypothetical protein MPER_07498 [Moniliophthora perniciosa FA553]|nr:hypothetical protein MPER_07498 [Moniliophthora perniciosa FA553]
MIPVHRVKSDKTKEYKEAAEKYYMGLVEDPRLHVKLTGSWETSVGDQDAFFHILEYENYGGYDNTTQLVRTSERPKFFRGKKPLPKVLGHPKKGAPPTNLGVF